MSYLERSLLKKHWKPRTQDSMGALKVQQDHGLSALVADCLVGRGIKGSAVLPFLAPKIRDFLIDPEHLKDMGAAVERTLQALDRQEKIVVFGDYDVDGATSGALLKLFFQALGRDVLVYIPDRLKEGYGPNIPALQELAAAGAQLVITVDCGTSAHAPLEEAARLGLDVIVLDHHAGEVKRPPAVALVNPNRVDEDSPYTYLAGVGVAFLFLVALQRRLRQCKDFCDKLPDLLSFLDLVALGTVCDVVPLTGLNRAFVSQGLKILAQREKVGLRVLMDYCGLQEKPTAYHLGFVLGPRLNAGGRVGDASLGVELLTTSNPHRAKDIAIKLEAYNQERRELEAQALQAAQDKIHALYGAEEDAPSKSTSDKGGLNKATSNKDSAVLPPALLVGDPDWHPGIIGIVAGRLKDLYHRPTFVLSEGEGRLAKGSGRSLPGIDLGALVHKAKKQGLLLAGGGHGMAAGLTLDLNHASEFHDFLVREIAALGGIGAPELAYDSVLSLGAVTVDLIETLETLGPFGQANPSPKIILKEVMALKATVVGQDHVRCYLSSPFGGHIEAIAFRALETPLGEALLTGQGRLMHLYGSLKNNEWNGGIRPQMMVEDGVFVAEAGPFLQAEATSGSLKRREA